MINLREHQQLQTALLEEHNKRFALQEKTKHYQQQAQRFEKELKKKTFQLKKAKAFATFSKKQTHVQDVIEQNIALQDQVQSLREAIKLMQKQTNDTQPDSEKDGDAQIHPMPTNELAMQDLSIVLGKLARKEQDLEAMKAECSVWENTVNELRLECHALRYQAEQKDVQNGVETLKNVNEKRSLQHRLVETNATNKTLQSKFNEVCQRLLQVEAERDELKEIITNRNKYWLQAKDTVHELRTQVLRQETQAQDYHIQQQEDQRKQIELQEEINTLTEVIQKQQTQVKRSRNETKQAQETLVCTMKQMNELTEKVKSIPDQIKMETAKAFLLIHDLRHELRRKDAQIHRLGHLVSVYTELHPAEVNSAAESCSEDA